MGVMPYPRGSSLQAPVNYITLRHPSLPHGLTKTAQVRVFMPYSTKAMPCQVDDLFLITCKLAPVSPFLPDRDMAMSLQISGSSTRYFISVPLKYFTGIYEFRSHSTCLHLTSHFSSCCDRNCSSSVAVILPYTSVRHSHFSNP